MSRKRLHASKRQFDKFNLQRTVREHVERRADHGMPADKMRERIAGDDERELPPARGENERLSRAEIELVKMHGEAERLDRPATEVVITDARAARHEQRVPAGIRHAAHRRDQCAEVVASPLLRHEIGTGFGNESGHHRRVAIPDLPRIRDVFGRDQLASRDDVEDARTRRNQRTYIAKLCEE